MTGQDTQVAQQVHAGCGHCSAQADQEVLGLEQDGSSAVFPDALQPQLQPTIGVLLKYALEHAREQGLVSIFLDSRPEVIDFYRTHGFAEHSATLMRIRVPR